MKKLCPFLSLAIASCLIALPLRAEQVTIFAASSLKTALDKVISDSQLDAIAVYGGSAAIARQVSQGAQADIVILAHPEWMDWLIDQNGVEAESRCNLLGNALMLAGAASSADVSISTAQDLIDALDGGRLAVGELRAVPAGQYAAQYLSNMEWLEDLRPHLAQTANVRLALALVARGETELGLVYASDVFAEPRVRTVFAPQTDTYPAIRYPMALINSENTAAQDVANVLIDDIATFTQLGFQSIPVDEAGRCS